jgi:hypothetical protein
VSTEVDPSLARLRLPVIARHPLPGVGVVVARGMEGEEGEMRQGRHRAGADLGQDPDQGGQLDQRGRGRGRFLRSEPRLLRICIS